MSKILTTATSGIVQPDALAQSTQGMDRANLIKGVVLGNDTYTIAVVRSLTFGDIMEAQEASEKVVATGKELSLIASPAAMGRETLRRQIARLETADGKKHDGPLSLEELRRLHPVDVEIIDNTIAHMDKVDALKLARGLEERGRTGAGAPAS